MLNQFHSFVQSPIDSSNSMLDQMNRFGATLWCSDYSAADFRRILMLMLARRLNCQRMRGKDGTKMKRTPENMC